jgi:gliding motility-associated-like protein
MGGDLTYTCVGNNRYKVTLSFYRDCNGVAAPTNCNNGLAFNYRSTDCGANVNDCLAFESVQVITPICATEIDRCNSASGVYGVEKYTFSKIINLTPWAGCGTDWIISWELCCRNNAVTSLVNPGNQRLYLDARLNNTVTPCNNSPQFLSNPTPFYCLGQSISYNPGASDPDGDQLQFALIAARGLGGANLTYIPGFSVAQPVANNGGGNAVVLNGTTGTMTVVPSIQQVAVVTYRVREFRNGVQVGEVTRDVQVVVRPCQGNTQPFATGINGTNQYTTTVCAGTPVNFSISSSDPNAGQAVTLTWNGGIPGATFTTSGSPLQTGSFSWTPTAANIGNNSFVVTAADNACPLVGTNDYGYTIIVTPPNTPVDAGPDQNVCGTSTTMAAVVPYPQVPGTWQVMVGSGTFSDITSPTSTVTGLAQGTNIFKWIVDYAPCGQVSDQVVITSFNSSQASANAGPDQQLCLPANSATLVGNSALSPAVGSWVLLQGSGTITSPNSATTTVTGLGVGLNIFEWGVNNDTCGRSSDEVSITVFSNSQTPANAGPDQSICAPASSVTMNANALVSPATGTWTLVSGTGTITSSGSPNTTITGLPVGVHTFQWTVSSGACGNTNDQVTITVFSASGTNANAGPDQQVCATTATFAGNTPTAPATGQWTLVSGSGIIANATAPNSAVSGLSAGANVFQWTVNNGPCTNGITTDQVTITVFSAAAPAANAGPDQNICGTGTTLAGNTPLAPATGTWTLVSGTGTLANANAPTTAVSGLGIGQNIFRWTVNNGPCAAPTIDLMTVFVFNPGQAPANAGPDQNLCVPTTIATLAANAPTFPATGQWSVVTGSGVFANASSPTTSVSGLGLGTNILRWTINNGPCANPVTFDEMTILVFNISAPIAFAGPDQNICSTSLGTTLTGSALVAPAIGNWTLVSGSGTIGTPNSSSTAVTGLSIGANVFRWSVSNGPCGSSADLMTVFVFDNADPVASAGPDQQFCTTTTSATMAGSVVTFPATGAWSLVSGSGTITSTASPTTTITGLGVGTNVFRWTVNNGPCGGVTTDEVTIQLFNNTAPLANAGPDQSICSSSTTVLMGGSAPVAPAVGTWTLVSGSGTITAPGSPFTSITGLAVGQNVFQWTVSNGPCGTTSDQVNIFVFNSTTPVANAGPDQNLCTPITSTVMAGSAVSLPATGTWTLVSGVGTITAPGSPSTSITGLGIGTNVFRWTVNNGPCGVQTNDLVSIVLYDQDADPADAGADQSQCSTTSSATLAGNAPVGSATGSWTLVSGSGTISSPNASNSGVTGLSVGTNVFQWSINNGPCGTSSDQVTIFVYSQSTPLANAGPDQNRCTPGTNVSMAGSILTGLSTGTWAVISGSGTITAPTSPTTTITSLGVGTNVFQWTVDNGPCGTSSDLVSILVYDQNNPVANAGPDQELCRPTFNTVLQGSSLIAPAQGIWTVISGTAVFADPNSPNTAVSGLSLGVNQIRWTVTNGPCGSATTDVMTITVFDDRNDVAFAGADQSICVPTLPNSTTLQGSAFLAPATGSWTLVSGSGTIVSPTSSTTLVSGLSVGENIFQWTVNNGPCANPVTSDQVSIFLFDATNPAANAGPDQTLCTPITSTLMNGSSLTFPATGTWTLVSGSGVIVSPSDPGTQITGLTVGANVFRWTINNGPCAPGISNDLVTINVFNGAAQTALAGPDQSICTTTASIFTAANTAIGPATGSWTVQQGTATFADATDPTTTVTGLSVGLNVLVWNITNGACGISSDPLTVLVYDNGQSVANAGPDQELCISTTVTTLNGSNTIFPGQGTWTLVQGSGVLADVNDPNTAVSGLSIGANVFQWTVDNGPCSIGITTDQVTVLVYEANNPVANAGPDKELCTPTASTQLAGSSVVFPATGLWTVVQGTGVFANASDPTTQVSGLSVGENIFQWTVNNGPCANPLTTDQVSIFVFSASNPVANAGVNWELCTPNNTYNLQGSSLSFPATGVWTLVSGTGTITNPASPTSSVTGLAIGENIFQWTVDNGPCANAITTDQVSIFVFDENNPVVDAGPDQDLCTPTTSTVLQGSAAIFPAIGTWTVVSGTAVLADDNSPTSAVSGLSIGLNLLQWSVNNEPCASGTSDDLVAISVYDASAPAAAAGPDQELCTTAPTTTLQANAAVGVAIGQWTVLQGSAVFGNDNSAVSSVSGLSVGENILQWTITNGPCGTTSDVVSVFLFDANNLSADAGADQDLCTPNTQSTLAGNAPIFPASGSWTVVSGSGVVTDPNDPTSTVNGLGIGANVFQWTVDNGSCSNGITTDQVTINVFDGNAPVADAGTDQELCTPATSATLAGNATVGVSVGTWSVAQGTGTFADPNDPLTTVTGLSAGANVFVWTIDNGPCGNSTDQVSIVLFNAGNPNANAGPDQELCAPTNTTTLSGSAITSPSVGTWVLVSGSGTIADPNDPNTAVSGLTVGENIFAWTVDNGPCANGITTDQVSIVLFDELNETANAGPDLEFCTPTTTATLSGSAITFPATGTWTLVNGTGTITDPNDPSTAVTGLGVGQNTFEWTVSNGPCFNGLTNDQVSIFVFDANNAVADAGPDQELCSPITTTILTGSAVTFPAQGQWTVVLGTGVFSNATDPNSLVTGLSLGENIFEWNVDNGSCSDALSTDQVSIFVFDANDPAADAGADQDLCTPTLSTVLSGNVPTFPATGSWTLVQGTGTIANATDPSTTVTGLGVGENIFAWTTSNGPCAQGLTTDEVSIFLFDQNTAGANAGPDQSLCTPTFSTTLQGSSYAAPSAGSWTLLSGSGIIADATDPNTLITGLAVGQNIFEWTIDNGPCSNGITTDQVSIFVFDANTSAANAGADQLLCAPINTTVLQGSAVIFPSFGTWTLLSGSGNVVDPTDPNSGVTGLAVGENIFVWSVNNGPCTNGFTSDQVSIFVFDANNQVAAAGPDLELCTPANSVALTGSTVTFPAVGTWTVTQGTGTFANANDPLTTVSALSVGLNTLVWTVENGPCAKGVTSDTLTITLFDDSNPVADAGPGAQLCTPTTSFVLGASTAVLPAIGTWTLVSGSGTFADVNDPTTTVSGLSIGNNVLQWTVSNGPCTTPLSSDLVTITVFDENNPLAAAGSDQQVCTPLTGATLAGSPVIFPAVGTWTLVSGQGTITDVNDPNTTVTALGIGENIFAWSLSNGPCANGSASDQVSIFLFDLNAPPAVAGPDQSQCTPNTSTVLAGNQPTGAAIGVWSLTQGTATFADPNDPLTGVTDLTAGENILTWTIDNGLCGISSDNVSIFIYDENNPPADAGPDVEICTPQDSVFLAGNLPTFPAQGTWSLVAGAGLFQDVNDPTSKVVGLAIGNNTFVWTVDNGPCNSPITTDTMTVVLYNDSTSAANAGPDLETCIPLTFVQLQADTPQLPATGTWSIVSGPGTVVDPADPTSVLNGLQLGITTLVWTLDNGPCASSGILTDTVQVVVYDPNAPAADAGADQELCTPQDSTVLTGNVPSFPGVGTWSLLAGTGVISDPNDPAATVTGLTIGVNTFVWTIYNGQCGVGPLLTDTVDVVLFDGSAPAADAGPDQEQCTPNISVGMAANAAVAPAVGTWSVVTGTANILQPNSPITNISTISVGSNVFVWTIDNGACGTTTDTVVVNIFDFAADAADAGPDQEICIPSAPNSVTMAGSVPVAPSTGLWTLVSGTGTIVSPGDPATVIADLVVGVHVFEWTIDNGPCGPPTSDQVTITVHDAASPSANAGPDQDLCTPTSSAGLSGSIPTFPVQGTWTIVSGSGTLTDATDPATTISGLTAGVTVLVWTMDNGPCPNGLTSDTLVITVNDANALASAAGPDQEFCSPIIDNVTMFANSPVFPAIGTWALLSGVATIAAPADPFTAITDLGLGENVFGWTVDNGACGTTTDQVSLFVYDGSLLPADAGPDQSYCQDTTTTALEALPVGGTTTSFWSLVSGTGTLADPSDPTSPVSGLTLGFNAFVWNVSNGACGTTTDTMFVELRDCSTIMVPNAFSPNGDGRNDLLVIQGLDNYPGNSIQIFNRWGNKVLDRRDYKNDWDGRSEGKMNWGDELPEGTYYYVLDLGNDDEDLTGYIYLRR